MTLPPPICQGPAEPHSCPKKLKAIQHLSPASPAPHKSTARVNRESNEINKYMQIVSFISLSLCWYIYLSWNIFLLAQVGKKHGFPQNNHLFIAKHSKILDMKTPTPCTVLCRVGMVPSQCKRLLCKCLLDPSWQSIWAEKSQHQSWKTSCFGYRYQDTHHGSKLQFTYCIYWASQVRCTK